MSGQVNAEKGRAFYDRHYANGGWTYDFRTERRWHRKHVVKRFGLRKGMRMLEVACGNGFHTDVFNRMGIQCIGVDRSEVGIESAKNIFPKWTYHCCDLREMPFVENEFDVIMARGCSHYHYDLMSDLALETTDRLTKLLRPGGVFVMIIVTDLSGRREPGKIWHNLLDDYRRHFSSFGKRWSVDWVEGHAVCGLINEADPHAGRMDRAPEVAAMATAT